MIDLSVASGCEASNARQRELGQYPTPVWVAEALCERHFSDLSSADFVAEPACGEGRFLGAVPSFVPAIGIEIDPAKAEQARCATGRSIITGDFCEVDLPAQPTVILGNPPFQLELVDRFLERSHSLLPDGGRVGFILPAYAFQTAARVAGYSDFWSIAQEMIPRNIFQGLKLPLVFAMFRKDRRRVLVGFALYRETADVQHLPRVYRDLLDQGSGPVWLRLVELALSRLGGEADLPQLYAELESAKPSGNRWWKEKIRQTLRRYADRFVVAGKGRYALRDRQPSRSPSFASQLVLAI